MKNKTKRTLIIIADVMCWLILLVSVYFNFIQLDAYETYKDKTTQSYAILNNSYEMNKAEHKSILEEKAAELSKVQEALDTALKNNQLVNTLLSSDMGEWTVESILATRDKFDLIPYGSPFKDGHIITGSWGSRELSGSYWNNSGHLGVDIYPVSGNVNEPVLAPMSGRVVNWGRNDVLYGNYIVIESLDKMFQIKFAHLSSIAVFFPDGKIDLYEGMEFTRGTRIARMGSTGKCTGPHLHMEYYISTPSSLRLLDADAILSYTGD